jgi:hypothetical protein
MVSLSIYVTTIFPGPTVFSQLLRNVSGEAVAIVFTARITSVTLAFDSALKCGNEQAKHKLRCLLISVFIVLPLRLVVFMSLAYL